MAKTVKATFEIKPYLHTDYFILYDNRIKKGNKAIKTSKSIEELNIIKDKLYNNDESIYIVKPQSKINAIPHEPKDKKQRKPKQPKQPKETVISL